MKTIAGASLSPSATMVPITTSVSAMLIQKFCGWRRAFSASVSVRVGTTSAASGLVEPEPPLLAFAEPPRDREDEDKSDRLDRHQRIENLGDRQLQRGRGADHRPRPGKEIDARRHRGRAGEDALVDSEPLVKRQHRRDGDEERHRARSVEMDEQREQGRAHHDARRLRAHGLQDPVDDRVEHARVGHDAEEQDREDEHADDRREALDAGDDELARVPAEPADQRRSDGNEDERHQRRHPFRHDDGEQ